MASSTYLAGNAPEDMKIAAAFKWDNWLGGPDAPGFGRDVRQGLRFTTLNVKDEPTPAGKAKRRVTEAIHEVMVTEDFLNGIGFMHGGCTAYLIDACSSIALTALDPPDDGTLPSVSLNLDVTYHAAASLGSNLRLISTVISFSTRVQTVRCEVWDISKPVPKLVASANHIKMQRSGNSASEAQAEEWRKVTYAGQHLDVEAAKAKL